MWATPWHTSTLPLPPGASEGTLLFSVEDSGDSIYDSVVLLDAIHVD